MGFGTNTSFDTLTLARATTVYDFGEDRVFDGIEMALETHNEQTDEMLQFLVEDTTDNIRSYGGPASMTMELLDEFGTPDAQKVFPDTMNIGFPCSRYGAGLQWTRDYFQSAMVSEVASQVTAMMDADILTVQRDLKRAFFYPTNYTFRDRHHPKKLDLPVKSLYNADSGIIPNAPDGQTFNSATHTHYLGTSSFAATDLDAGFTTVNEHFLSGEMVIYINIDQVAAVEGFSGFVKLEPGSLILATNAVGLRGNLDIYNVTNRWIGNYKGIQVWVKPWIPSGYVLFLHRGTGDKVLCRRSMRQGSGNLELIFENEQYPLRSKAYRREFGIGVWNRAAAAVLDTAHSTYNAPTIN